MWHRGVNPTDTDSENNRSGQWLLGSGRIVVVTEMETGSEQLEKTFSPERTGAPETSQKLSNTSTELLIMEISHC